MQKVLKSMTKGLAIIVATLMLVILSSPVTFAQGGLTKIADNVYSYIDTKNASPQNSFGANAGVIIGRDGIAVVDTLISAKQAKAFIEDIRAISDKPIKYVINTHYHLDHTFGNSEFEKLGAIIISHTVDKENLKMSGEKVLMNIKNYGLSEQDMEGTKIVYPMLTFTDRMEIDLGDQVVELIYTGVSHTEGSILVNLPDKKLLFAGDVLFTGYHAFVAGGDIQSWVNVLDYIQAMDVTTIIPGHGPLSTKKDIADMKQYLLIFDEKAKELCANSKDLEYITSELKKVLPERAEGPNLIKGSVQRKYLK